jgi:hypothetical protein
MKYITSIIAFSALILAVLAITPTDVARGGDMASQGRVFSVATTSVGHQTDITIASAKEFCASRVISTTGNAIMLSFATSTLNPSGTEGFYQGPSTTVAYDSEQYGCGYVVAASLSTTTISVAEFVY